MSDFLQERSVNEIFFQKGIGLWLPLALVGQEVGLLIMKCLCDTKFVALSYMEVPFWNRHAG